MLPLHYVTSVMKNLEALGFTFSEALIKACQALSLDELTVFYRQLVADLRKAKGAHRAFRPMYANFPSQVMAEGEAALYLNALIHYWSGGKLVPYTEAQNRLPLLDPVELQVIGLGSDAEFEGLFGQIASSNASLSEQDKEDLAWYVAAYAVRVEGLMPEAIPQKENMAFLAGLLLRHTERAEVFIARYCRTATDVLRLAVALSEGDVSLAKSAKFRTFSRPERRLMLSLLEGQPNLTEDMLRWKGRWVRLGEKLHPGERRRDYPKAAGAFDVLRDDLPFTTFNGTVEKAMETGNIARAVARLSARPGDFARRLDHLLRQGASDQDMIVVAFSGVAEAVATPVLLQVREHFRTRGESPPLRVFFPKGNLGKAHAEENDLPLLPVQTCASVVDICTEALTERFRALAPLAPLGKVWVDPKLSDYLVPFAARSASRSFRTIARGSRVPLPEGCEVLRFFVWWKNGSDRTDIDLSATMFDADFGYQDIVSYYNLKNYGGVHSGDIVDAPKGASEFIDISLDKVRRQGVRYVVMTLSSYTQQPYAELPECFAGWMSRVQADSGEIYDPRTVQDRLDVTAATRIALPLVIDVQEKKVVWCDMALRSNPKWQNNVHGGSVPI